MEVEMDDYSLEEMEERPSGCQRVVRVILRLAVILVLGITLGAGIYFGVPRLYRDFIAPIQENQQRLTDLELALEKEKESASRQIAQLGDRLAEVEGRQAMQAEELAAAQASLESLRTLQTEQASELARLDDLAEELAGLSQDYQEIETRLTALESDLTSLEIPAGRIGRQLQLIRVMTLLTRARLSLVQDNLGLAAADIETATQILAETIASGSQVDALTLNPILDRLELALEDVRLSPVIAADELEIAWKLLVEATSTEPQVIEEALPTESATEEEADAAE